MQEAGRGIRIGAFQGRIHGLLAVPPRLPGSQAPQVSFEGSRLPDTAPGKPSQVRLPGALQGLSVTHVFHRFFLRHGNGSLTGPKSLILLWYSWGDLNHRPPDPQSGALTN